MPDAKPRWRTAIAHADHSGAIIAGYRVDELMRKLDFASSLFVLYQQRVPEDAERKMLDAMLVAMIDHGIVPSSAVTRIVSASGVPLQTCVAAGLLTIGDVHGGAGEEIGRKLAETIAECGPGEKEIANVARELVAATRKAKARLDGYGHPMHPDGDDRVRCLVELARDLDMVGPHLALALAMEAEIAVAVGRPVPLNVDGALAAVCLDLGFDWRLIRAFIMIPRAAGLAAHAVEERVRERGWRVVAAPGEVLYDGPAERVLPDV